VAGEETVATEGVRVAFLLAGATRLELLEPTHADSPVAKFLARRGEGIHHVTLEVESVEAILDRLRRAGGAPPPPGPPAGGGRGPGRLPPPRGGGGGPGGGGGGAAGRPRRRGGALGGRAGARLPARPSREGLGPPPGSGRLRGHDRGDGPRVVRRLDDAGRA